MNNLFLFPEKVLSKKEQTKKKEFILNLSKYSIFSSYFFHFTYTIWYFGWIKKKKEAEDGPDDTLLIILYDSKVFYIK